jgi:hypothetical protein
VAREPRPQCAGEVADRAAPLEPRADRARYQIDRAKDIALAGLHGIDEIMRVEQLDAAAGERVVR